ncbi:MAG: hypothetical protein KA956_13980, partial [Pyrinomonadaceae bacterium]|nr:hypothetical protein [Acidobacteriota bacterium]MBP7377579.1 hypothetical protein [Pyrinomonadaceae bacterium]
MLNHLPLFAGLFGTLILAWGLLRKFENIQFVGLILIILNALASVPVYLTGEPAEDVVEKLPGVSEQLIEAHESAAMFALIIGIIAGVAAIVAFASARFASKSFNTVAVYAALIAGLVSAVSMGYTANLGGQVRHSEIRQAQTLSPAGEKKTETRRSGDDDDH